MTHLTVVAGGGVRIACTDSGGADRPVMVLLHALGEGRGDWSGAPAQRFGARFRLISLDLRGHGDSDHPGDYSVALMSRDVEQVLDALGLVRVVLVGHSLGGAVAFELASRRPDLVSALVAEDVSPSLGRPPRPVPDRPQVDLPFDWAAVVAIRAEADRGDPAQWSALSRLAVPTLIVAGGPTSSLEQSTLAQAAELISSGSLVTIDAGHYVHRERPEEFCDAVLGWLDGVDV